MMKFNFKKELKLGGLNSKPKKFLSSIAFLGTSFFAIAGLSAVSRADLGTSSPHFEQKTSRSLLEIKGGRRNFKLEPTAFFLIPLLSGVGASFIGSELHRLWLGFIGANNKESEINSKLDNIQETLKKQEAEHLEITEREKLLLKAFVLRDSVRLLLKDVDNLLDLVDEIRSLAVTLHDQKKVLEIMSFLSEIKVDLLFLKIDIIDFLQKINLFILELL